MVTYDAITMVYQFGMFFLATVTAVVAVIALFINKKK